MRYVVTLVTLVLAVAAPASGQDAAPVTSRDALLTRARAFAEDDRRFNLLRLEMARAQERLMSAEEAVGAFREGKTVADLQGDPALRRRAELLMLEAQVAREEYEKLGTGAGRARYVSLRDKLARQLPELIGELDRALGAQDDVELRLARGELLVGKGRFADARRDAEAAIRERPEDPRALGLLAMCLVTDNRFEEAAALFQRAVELGPDDERHAYLAIALYCTNRFAEARAVRDRIAKVKELSASLQVRCSWWLTDGELERAAAAWAREEAARREEEQKGDLPRIELVTSKGSIVLELFEDHAPNAAAGLIALVEAGFYDGLPWKPIEPNVLVQTGDPALRPGAAAGAPHDPGWRLKDDPAPLDPARARPHLRGSVSLVREGGRPDSAAGLLFISLMPAPLFEGRHAVIGRVVEGQAVADRLRDGDRVERGRVVRKRDHPYVPTRTVPR